MNHKQNHTQDHRSRAHVLAIERALDQVILTIQDTGVTADDFDEHSRPRLAALLTTSKHTTNRDGGLS